MVRRRNKSAHLEHQINSKLPRSFRVVYGYLFPPIDPHRSNHPAVWSLAPRPAFQTPRIMPHLRPTPLSHMIALSNLRSSLPQTLTPLLRHMLNFSPLGPLGGRKALLLGPSVGMGRRMLLKNLGVCSVLQVVSRFESTRLI